MPNLEEMARKKAGELLEQVENAKSKMENLAKSTMDTIRMVSEEEKANKNLFIN